MSSRQSSQSGRSPSPLATDRAPPPPVSGIGGSLEIAPADAPPPSAADPEARVEEEEEEEDGLRTKAGGAASDGPELAPIEAPAPDASASVLAARRSGVSGRAKAKAAFAKEEEGARKKAGGAVSDGPELAPIEAPAPSGASSKKGVRSGVQKGQARTPPAAADDLLRIRETVSAGARRGGGGVSVRTVETSYANGARSVVTVTTDEATRGGTVVATRYPSPADSGAAAGDPHVADSAAATAPSGGGSGTRRPSGGGGAPPPVAQRADRAEAPLPSSETVVTSTPFAAFLPTANPVHVAEVYHGVRVGGDGAADEDPEVGPKGEGRPPRVDGCGSRPWFRRHWKYLALVAVIVVLAAVLAAVLTAENGGGAGEEPADAANAPSPLKARPPSSVPTIAPSPGPTISPSLEPTPAPSLPPTDSPSQIPSEDPSAAPTMCKPPLAFDERLSVNGSQNLAADGIHLVVVGGGRAHFHLLQGKSWSPSADFPAGNSSWGFAALSGTIAVVGADLDDGGAGAAYVFELKGRSLLWGRTARLVADDAIADGGFGSSVAVDAAEGGTIVVGAARASRAYVFRRDGASGSWKQEATLASVPYPSQFYFGDSVAVGGGTVAVASPYESSRKGAIYLYDRDGSSSWKFAKKITNSRCGELFGWSSIAIDGEGGLAVACRKEASYRGAMYYYSRSDAGGGYVFRQRLVAADGGPADEFGDHVDIDNDTMVVATAIETANGRAYVFKRSREMWAEVATVRPPGLLQTSYFGNRVAVAGNRIVTREGSGGGVYAYSMESC